MLTDNPRTSSIRLAVFQASFPGQPIRTYLEVPFLRRNYCLAAITEHFKKLNVWGVSTRAFIEFEFLDHKLSETGKQIIGAYENGFPEKFINLIKEPVITLVEKLIDQPKPEHEQSETEAIRFNILNIEEHVDTIPGIYAEITLGSNISDGIKQWKGADSPPDDIIGHVAIEVYSAALSEDAKHYLKVMELGDPEEMEELVKDGIASIFSKLFRA